MGSIVLAYSFIKKIKEEYSAQNTFFLTFEGNRALFKIFGLIPDENIITIREGSSFLFIRDTLKAVDKIRKKNIDIVFDLELFCRFTAILSYLSAAPRRVGFYPYHTEGLYRGEFLTHKVQYNCRIHISKSYLSLWQAAREPLKNTPDLAEQILDNEISLPEISTAKETKSIWDKLKGLSPEINYKNRLLLLNPGEGKIPLREWPLENFIALARKLLEDEKNYIIVIGFQMISKKAQVLCKSVNNERCLDLSNKTTLTELFDLYGISTLLVTNDGGLAHLASLRPIKKFVFFGPESPHLYSPLGDSTQIIYSDLPCSPCFSAFNQRESACEDNKCLQIIKADDVYNLIKYYLGDLIFKDEQL
ncbi:MAG: glycosyltransferase family 9 protein [Candidatus Omnitrophica bacterium]|nr:glycosyltransferase family 9 protein [Candidatus Omnitrophota bacterium]MBU4467244.1 glycosyltransferase family 9 protein [Candidatus Omnitrophota bacterium]MCG2707104.1 glycosyltransferase family 9 protein [Candidatus Omnitrophota bacterium]